MSSSPENGPDDPAKVHKDRETSSKGPPAEVPSATNAAALPPIVASSEESAKSGDNPQADKRANSATTSEQKDDVGDAQEDTETSQSTSETTDPPKKSSQQTSQDASKSGQVTYTTDEDGKLQPTEESGPEITGIMDQFQSGQQTPAEEGPGLPVFQYPPRGSSLENRRASAEIGEKPPTALKRTDTGAYSVKSQASERSSMVSQPPPPAPDPEPDLPFDFHRFLEQLRHRSADPVAKFLKSFLHEFGKRQWAVSEQIKIVRDFLSFISGRMGQCEVWRTVSDAEFDNAQEGMEKLVMNRLYTQTFSPEIPPPQATKGKRGASSASGPGRKGQHQDDVEKDEVLAQKIRIYGWIKEEHLDITPAKDAKGRKFLRLAQQELVKIQSYRAPRDKIICILNSCKVLFGYLRSREAEQSADDFLPLLIYTVLKGAPEHIVSNVNYIQRFRNPEKLSGEAGYYMSSLLGAVAFIEGLDRTSLTISDEDYEKNVEQAVAAIAERRSREETRPVSSTLPFNEKSGLSRPEVTPRHSMDAEHVSPRRKANRTNSSANAGEGTAGDESDENAAVAGLLRTIQKPLSTIGRIFSDDGGAAASGSGPARTPQPGATPRMSPTPQATGLGRDPSKPVQSAPSVQTRKNLSAEEAAARQASAETAEAQRMQRAEHQTVVETLSGMFPDLDREIISDVVREKEGRVGLAVDACLALSR